MVLSERYSSTQKNFNDCKKTKPYKQYQRSDAEQCLYVNPFYKKVSMKWYERKGNYSECLGGDGLN
jgi:hypothetical protein